MMTIVLLPGLDGTGILFKAFASLMEADFNVTVVSYPLCEPLDYVELQAVASAFLPTEGPFVILGESFSGPIAISLAKSCSSQLRGVILSCSFVRNPRPFFRSFQFLVGLIPISAVPRAVWRFFLLGKFAPDVEQLALFDAISKVSIASLRARLKAVLTVDVSEELSALSLPILYLRASDDRVVPHRESEFICLTNPNTRVVEIDAPHLLLQTAPGDAAKTVGDFIREVQDAV